MRSICAICAVTLLVACAMLHAQEPKKEPPKSVTKAPLEGEAVKGSIWEMKQSGKPIGIIAFFEHDAQKGEVSGKYALLPQTAGTWKGKLSKDGLLTVTLTESMPNKGRTSKIECVLGLNPKGEFTALAPGWWQKPDVKKEVLVLDNEFMRPGGDPLKLLPLEGLTKDITAKRFAVTIDGKPAGELQFTVLDKTAISIVVTDGDKKTKYEGAWQHNRIKFALPDEGGPPFIAAFTRRDGKLEALGWQVPDTTFKMIEIVEEKKKDKK